MKLVKLLRVTVTGKNKRECEETFKMIESMDIVDYIREERMRNEGYNKIIDICQQEVVESYRQRHFRITA